MYVSLWVYIYLEICSICNSYGVMFAKCHITFYSSNVCYYLKFKNFWTFRVISITHTKLWKTLYNFGYSDFLADKWWDCKPQPNFKLIDSWPTCTRDPKARKSLLRSKSGSTVYYQFGVFCIFKIGLLDSAQLCWIKFWMSHYSSIPLPKFIF